MMDIKINLDDDYDIGIISDNVETITISFEDDENQIGIVILNKILLSLNKEIRAYIKKYNLKKI
ncbi:MAG: hypothetical protein ACFFG0_26515 [Candidatus Thorarchaeota archaeon]